MFVSPQAVSHLLVKEFKRSKRTVASRGVVRGGWSSASEGFTVQKGYSEGAIRVDWLAGSYAKNNDGVIEQLNKIRDFLVEQGFKVVEDINPEFPGWGFHVKKEN